VATAHQLASGLRPLLNRHTDLALVGRLVVIKPVDHILRAIIVDRTSSAERVVPRWFACHTFWHHPFMTIGWGAPLYRTVKGGWDTSDSTMYDQLIERIEANALPRLRSIQSLSDFATFVLAPERQHHFKVGSIDRDILDLALGCQRPVQEIVETASRTIDSLGKSRKLMDIDTIEIARLQALCQALQSRSGRATLELLHGWESDFIQRNKLTSLWQPALFPVESSWQA